MSPAQTSLAPLRVGILSFAHVHAESYARHLAQWPGVELLATDPDAAGAPAGEPRGREFAESLGVAYVDSLDQLLAWRPDAVIVASENAHHRRDVELLAAAGVHILCEKPLATTRADAEAMLEACRAAGVGLMLAYPTRFSAAANALAALVDDGGLGTIIAASGTNNGKLPSERAWFTDPELAGGGALVDHVVHVADLLERLTGKRAVLVHAMVNHILHAGEAADAVETGGLVTVSYEGGLIATIDCSWSHPQASPTWGGLTLELVGTLGLATIAPFDQRLGGFSQRDGTSIALPYGDDADRAMLAEFLAAVRAGRHAQPDGEVGLRTLAIVLAAQESVRTGAPVRV